MSRVVDRAFEIASAVFAAAPRDGLAHPFGFAEHPTYLWRISRDVWNDLRDYVGFYVPEEPRGDERLLGEPLVVDDSLPPNSMLFSPATAGGTSE